MSVADTLARIEAGLDVTLEEFDEVLRLSPKQGKGPYIPPDTRQSVYDAMVAAGAAAAPLESTFRQGCSEDLNPIVIGGPMSHEGTTPFPYSLCGVTGVYGTPRVRIGSGGVGPVGTIPSSIDSTGATEVSNELNEFFASSLVPDGSTIQFPDSGHYWIERPLVFNQRHFLTLEMNGCRLFAQTPGTAYIPPNLTTKNQKENWLRERCLIDLVLCSNINLRNGILKGANPLAGAGAGAYKSIYEAQHAIALHGSSFVDIGEGMVVTDPWGDFVWIGGTGGQGQTWSSNIRIHHGTFSRNGRQAIAVVRGEDVMVEYMNISQVQRATIDLEPNSLTGGCKRFTLRRSTIGPGKLKFVASGGSGDLVEDVTIGGPLASGVPDSPTGGDGNKLVGRSMDCVFSAGGFNVRRRRIKVLHNTSDSTFGSPLALIRLSDVDDFEVAWNFNRLQTGRDTSVVFAVNSSGANVHDNQCENMGLEYEVGGAINGQHGALQGV